MARRLVGLVVSLLFVISIGAVILPTPSAAGTPPTSLNVLYVKSSAGSEDTLLRSLSIDSSLVINQDFSQITLAGSGGGLLAKFAVVVLVDPMLDAGNISILQSFLAVGGGLVLVAGPHLAAQSQILDNFSIVLQSALGQVASGMEQVFTQVNEAGNVFSSIDWNSCPEIKNYTLIPSASASLGTNVIVDLKKKPLEAAINLDPNPMLLHLENGNGRIIFFAPWLADPALDSVHLWPYFNYIIYSSIILAAHQTPLVYGDWQYSPVPHFIEQVLWVIMLSILTTIVILVFRRQRRKSRQAIDEQALAKLSEEKKTEKSAPQAPEPPTVPAGTPAPVEQSPSEELEPRLLKQEEINEWEEIGYHRQLSGFMFALFMTILLMGPQLLLTIWVYPNYIMPYPQAGGYYSFVQKFFDAFWTFLDFGTSTALVKYFAQYRVKQPKKAIRYVQIFIYWQFLSGIGQFATVSIIGLFIFPYTNYAHMSWFFIMHSMIQFPGFLSLFIFFFQGVQRIDLAQILEILKTIVFAFGIQYLMILVGRQIYGGLPIYGQVFGVVIGMELGNWISEWLFFGSCFKIFKKAGFSGKSLWRVDFTRVELIEVFKYGIKLVAGSIWVPIVWMLQVVMLSMYVTNYSSEMAFFEMASTLSSITALVGIYLNGMNAPISEAHGNNKPKLLGLGIVEMLRIMNWIGFTVVALMAVGGNRIILGFSGENWARATLYMPGLLLHGALGPYSWSADRIFQGTGRTDLNMYTWFLEQGIRAILLILLVPPFGVMGVIIGYNIALASKGVAVWILIRKKIARPPWYAWKTFVAPALSALSLYVLFESFARLVWVGPGDIGSTILIVAIGLFSSFFLSTFFAGFFGLWDEKGLAEFDKATKMVKTVRPLARFLYRCAWAGAVKLHSPFVKVHRIDIYDAAMEEARALTREKRLLEV